MRPELLFCQERDRRRIRKNAFKAEKAMKFAVLAESHRALP